MPLVPPNPPDVSKLELKVVLDTNAAYTERGGYLLGYEITQLIKNTAGDDNLRVSWYLPDIVVAERRYQIEQQAINLKSSVAKFENVLRHTFNVTHDVMLSKIKDSVDAQILEHGLRVCPSDPAKIDWNVVIGSAVSRKPPFDPSPDTEKGFRDALILEAFKQLVQTSPTDSAKCRLVLLTRDQLLATAAAAATSGIANVAILGTFDEVKDLINTLLSSLSEDTVAKLRTTAKPYFYDQESQSGIFTALEIANRIKEACRDQLAEVPSGAYRRDNEAKWLIASGPSFLKKVHERVWWTSKVKVRSQAYASTFQFTHHGSAISTFDADVPDSAKSAYTWASSGDVLPGSGAPSASTVFFSSSTSALSSPEWSTNARLNLPHHGTVTFSLPLNMSPLERLVARGVTTVAVNWSVAVDGQGAFTDPKVENIEFLGTEWENVA